MNHNANWIQPMTRQLLFAVDGLTDNFLERCWLELLKIADGCGWQRLRGVPELAATQRIAFKRYARQFFALAGRGEKKNSFGLES